MTLSELIVAHNANFGNPTRTDIYRDDILIEFPYAPKHHTGRLEGKERVLGFLTAIGKYFHDIEMGEPKIHLTQDPNVAISEVPGGSTATETGLPYRQNYISVFTVKDGQIAHIREYYNPVQVLVATGEITEPGEEG